MLKKLTVTALVFLFSFSNVFAKKSRVDDLPDLDLSQEEQATLVRPAVVRIISKIEGEIEVPGFEIRSGKVRKDYSKKKQTIPLEDYVSYGSGFVVNTDGYIVTNSHVVSDKYSKLQALYSVLLKSLYGYSSSYTGDDDEGVMDLLDQLMDISDDNTDTEIVVVNPESGTDKVEDLLDDGFEAEIVEVNDEFYSDMKDIALIKIDEDELPAVPVNEDADFDIGSDITLVGFPATAELAYSSSTDDELDGEASITRGVINAFKDVDGLDYEMIQTDAKFSQGSSGGPLLNEDGEVVGIITLGSFNPYVKGDNFAFALPVDLVLEIMDDNDVENDLGDYAPHYLAGLEESKEKHCKKAIKEYKLADNGNSYFALDDYLEDSVDDCKKMIRKGVSIDSFWDRAWKESGWEKVVLMLFVFAVILIVPVVIFRKRLKRVLKGMKK